MLWKWKKALAPPAVLLAGAAFSPDVFAQDVDTFKPSGSQFDGWGSLQLVHPEIGLGGGYYVGLGLVYADEPLITVLEDDSRTTVVRDQFSTRLALGYNLLGRVRAEVEVPFYPVVRLGEGAAQSALGDVRLAATVPLLRYDAQETGEDGFGVALAPYLKLPTGDETLFLSNGTTGGGLLASAGGRFEAVGMTANLGVDLDQAVQIGEIADQGAELLGGVGISYWLSREWSVGAELTTRYTLAGETRDWNESPTELHAYGTWGDSDGLFVTLGGGTGVIAGIGAPDYRGLLLLGWRQGGSPLDQDRDGLIDSQDACPADPEDVDSFEDTDGCPDPDNDRDGVLDPEDSCPSEPEDVDQWEDRDGCPDPDNDSDQILDVDDACPIDAGIAELMGCPDQDGDKIADRDDECPAAPGPASAKGCPDRDGDRVPDKRDDCPDEPADSRIDPKRSNGCPRLAFVDENKRIVILEKIFFDFDRDTIKPVSFPVLDEVAKVMTENSDILLVEVAGHTDSQGTDEYNLDLSARRTASVARYLVEKGIAAQRLQSAGYGEAKPIDTNDTEEGRSMNRRVEFLILKQEGVEDAPAEEPERERNNP